MTTAEFNLEFNILYDNIASNGAPGVNKYEKSVFLTQAQEQIIKEYYSGKSSPAFESDEKRRRDILDITIPYSTSVYITSSEGINPNSKFFVIPTNTWYIIHERLQISAPGECFDQSIIDIRPVTHDEYNISVNNPFRKPNERKAWRLDINLGGGSKVVEIISSYEPVKYFMRYIKKPSPIVLTNLVTDPDVGGLGLTVDGVTAVTECALNSEIHREILNRAVELAIGSYRENSLSNKVQLNKRSV